MSLMWHCGTASNQFSDLEKSDTMLLSLTQTGECVMWRLGPYTRAAARTVPAPLAQLVKALLLSLTASQTRLLGIWCEPGENKSREMSWMRRGWLSNLNPYHLIRNSLQILTFIYIVLETFFLSYMYTYLKMALLGMANSQSLQTKKS